MRYLVTINFHDFMPPNARESLACAAGRWGMQFVEITQPWTDADPGDIFRHKHTICKFPAWRFGDEVTLVDADILIRDDAPYPFTSAATFAGVAGLQDGASVGCADEYAKRSGVTIEAAKYINGGLLRFYPHLHASVFVDVLRALGDNSIGPMEEQTVLNAVLANLGDGLEVQSDFRFNVVGQRAWDEDMSDQYVKHFARWGNRGRDNAERVAAIQGTKWRTKQ